MRFSFRQRFQKKMWKVHCYTIMSFKETISILSMNSECVIFLTLMIVIILAMGFWGFGVLGFWVIFFCPERLGDFFLSREVR